MKQIKLDVKDRKILNELDFDARQSYSQIARKVSLSKDTVQYRIKRLESQRIIEGYYAIIDPLKLGKTIYRVCLKFRNANINKEKEIINSLKSNKSVNWISLFNGRWDMIVGIITKNLNEFQEVISSLFSKYEKYIQEKTISSVISIHHFKNRLITNSKSSSETIIGTKIDKSKMDEIDLKILSILAKNARIPTIDIATKLKLTANTIENHIRKLIKEKVILNFRAKLNTRLLGLYHYKIFLNLQNVNSNREKEILYLLKSDSKVIYITKAVGLAELEVEILVKDIEEFYRFIKEVREKIGNNLKSYESVLVYKEEYIKYF